MMHKILYVRHSLYTNRSRLKVGPSYIICRIPRVQIPDSLLWIQVRVIKFRNLNKLTQGGDEMKQWKPFGKSRGTGVEKVKFFVVLVHTRWS